ncbi:MAG TPA: DUF4384 domain-containing protein [Stellaceae bacterium]|nr:DUF4384 domain-containing protein [Stellaceae bacterium]
MSAGCAVAHRTDIMREDVLSDAQQAIADAKLSHGDLTIAGSVDRPDATYAPGQPITLSAKVDKDAFVAILRVLPGGETTIVCPNRAHRDPSAKTGAVLSVPAPGEQVKIAADKPGVVLFEFIASTTGKSWLFTRAPDDGSDFAYLGVTTREIAKDLVSGLKVGGPAPTASSQVTVRISGGGLL